MNFVVFLVCSILINGLFSGWARVFSFAGLLEIVVGAAVQTFFMWLAFSTLRPKD
ncbi:hypothetical protein [Alloscardovia omnicolens]|uniref:hypothetical protein n=1 Tax=Alloscardovia omnicolens TaxID=419015 RepID=UPI003A6B2651